MSMQMDVDDEDDRHHITHFDIVARDRPYTTTIHVNDRKTFDSVIIAPTRDPEVDMYIGCFKFPKCGNNSCSPTNVRYGNGKYANEIELGPEWRKKYGIVQGDPVYSLTTKKAGGDGICVSRTPICGDISADDVAICDDFSPHGSDSHSISDHSEYVNENCGITTAVDNNDSVTKIPLTGRGSLLHRLMCSSPRWSQAKAELEPSYEEEDGVVKAVVGTDALNEVLNAEGDEYTSEDGAKGRFKETLGQHLCRAYNMVHKSTADDPKFTCQIYCVQHINPIKLEVAWTNVMTDKTV